MILRCGLLRLCMMAGCPPDQGVEFSRPFPFSSSEKTESASDGSATGSELHTHLCVLCVTWPDWPPRDPLHTLWPFRHALPPQARPLEPYLSQPSVPSVKVTWALLRHAGNSSLNASFCLSTAPNDCSPKGFGCRRNGSLFVASLFFPIPLFASFFLIPASSIHWYLTYAFLSPLLEFCLEFIVQWPGLRYSRIGQHWFLFWSVLSFLPEPSSHALSLLFLWTTKNALPSSLD